MRNRNLERKHLAARAALAAWGLFAAAAGCSGGGATGDQDADVADAVDDDVGGDAPVDVAGETEGDDEAAEGGLEDAGEDSPADGWATRVVTMAYLQILPGYGPVGGTSVWMCRCEGPRPPPPEGVAEEGACRLGRDEYQEPLDPSTCVPLDVGEIVLTMDGREIPLEYDGSVHPCLFQFAEDLSDLAAGTTVRLTGTGGADVPAFDHTFTMPPHVSMTDPPTSAEWTVGDPWEVWWEPAAVLHARMSAPSSGHLSLLCEATTAPPLVAPASITALWDELDAHASVNVVVSDALLVAGPVPLSIEVGWGFVSVVTFLPPP